MQVQKESFVKLLDEVKAVEKEARALSANKSATTADYVKTISSALKLLRKVKSLEKKA